MEHRSKTTKNALPRRLGLFVLFAALALAGMALLNFAIVDDVHSYTKIMMQEMYDYDGNIDTLFLGPSHCYRAYDPAMASERLGENCFNAGSSLQMPDGSYYMLLETAKHHKLKRVVLECFYGTFKFQRSNEQPNAAYLLTDYMKNSPEKFEYLWKMGGAAAVFDNFVPARHNTLSPGDIAEAWRVKLSGGVQPGDYTYVTYPEEEYQGDGFVYVNIQNPEGMTYPEMYPVEEEAVITPYAGEYLDKIADFCAANDIELLFVTAPLPSALLQNTPTYQLYVDFMRDYAASKGSRYWDFSLTTPASGLEMSDASFSDTHHLSGLGAEAFTESFCRVLLAAEQSSGTETAYFYDTVAEKLANAPDGTIR